jgi:hypothetical protein
MRDIATYEYNAWGKEGSIDIGKRCSGMLEVIKGVKNTLESVMTGSVNFEL